MGIPKHIKVLSILFFLNAALALIIGGLTFFSFILSPSPNGSNLADLSTAASGFTIGMAINILLTVLAVTLLILLGLNLRKLKPWARTVSLLYGALTIVLSLLNLLAGDHNFSYHFLVQVYAVWVLTRPEIKEAFLS